MGNTPESLKPVTLVLTVAICAHVPPEVGARWILNPETLLELSCQFRVIWLLEMALAVKLDGAPGAAGFPAQTLLARRRLRTPVTALRLMLRFVIMIQAGLLHVLCQSEKKLPALIIKRLKKLPDKLS